MANMSTNRLGRVALKLKERHRRGRCRSTFQGNRNVRCDKPRGHVGAHRWGYAGQASRLEWR